MDSNLILNFLAKLKKNNNTEWFHANKAEYESAKKEFINFVTKLIPKIAQFDDTLKTLNPKDTLFRINRDIRFSKDKNPYKTNFGAYMVNGGRKSPYAGYYLHMEPNESFISGGIYMPQPDVLKSLRKEIYYNITDFKKIIENKEFKKVFGEIQGTKLTNAPKDFPKDFEDIELLKFKDYYVWHKLNDSDFEKNNFLDEIISEYKLLLPLSQFMNKAVYSAKNEKL